MRHRIIFAISVVLFLPSLFAQPCLLSDASQAEIALDGMTQPFVAKLTPVELSPRLTIVLLPGSIPAAESDHVSSSLIALYKAAGKLHPLALATYNGNGFTTTGSLSTSIAWRNAVREALAADAAPAPSSVASLFTNESLAGDWSTVLFIGALPEPQAEVRDYALSRLSPRICALKARIAYWNPAGGPSQFWSSVADLTAGHSVSAPADALQSPGSTQWAEATWPVPPLDFGFALYHGKLQTPAAPAAEVTLAAAAPGVQLPDLDTYAEWLSIDHQLSAAPAPKQVRALFERALAINARDSTALRAAADYYKAQRDYRSAASYLDKLTRITPRDASLQAELGHSLFAAGDMDAAERALGAAHDAKTGGAAVTLELARIHLTRHDDAGALPFLDETLALEPSNTELWYARADAARRTGDKAKVAESLEKALALDPRNLERRTALIELYMERAAAADALRHIRIVTADLPADAAVRRRYAEFLDALKQPDEALAAWRKAVEADGSNEQAHYRVARLLLDKGAVRDSIDAADAGIEAAPKSARLYLIKAEALGRDNRSFDARRTLRDASQTVKDPDLLARLAEMEDISGRSAPQAYMALALSLEQAHSTQPPQLLARALEVSVRDGDRKAAEFFRARLAAANAPVAFIAPAAAAADQGAATVPGGLDALAFIAHMRYQSTQTFFGEYCRTLITRLTGAEPQERNAYLESIHNYFRAIADLKLAGKVVKGGAEITVSAANKNGRERSQQILETIGWKLKSSKAGATVEAGEKGAQALRQETASALAIDEVGMREALAAGKSFTFNIPDEPAPLLLGESTWVKAFFPKNKLAGGFAEALTTDLRVAKTYAALNAIGARAVAALISGTDLKTLAEKHADVLFRQGAAFALEGDHAAVPGGAAAEAIWAKMAGASPAEPGKFFRALLEKDDGKLLAYFAMLGHLDTDRQRFVTRSAPRTQHFYELYLDSEDIGTGAGRAAHSSSFTEFLQQLPLDSDLHILFPGGPEVWTVFRGNSASISQSAKLAKRLSRITGAEQEDTIIDRLSRNRYILNGERLSLVDYFVAVAQIDRHRSDPLDEQSALLLAENYGAAKWVYPYFTELTGLGQPQFEHFFALAAQLGSSSRVELNVTMGELHALIELISLTQQTGALDAKSAADLFDRLCAGFKSANSPGAYAQASFDVVRELLNRLSPKQPGVDADRAIETALLGNGPPAWFKLGGEFQELDAFALRHAAYRKVLDEQHVPSLTALLEFYGHLQDLANGRGSAAGHVNALDSLRARLLTVELPKKVKAEPIDRKLIDEFDKPKVDELVARLKRQLEKKKPDLKNAQEICGELTSVIGPEVKLALSGIIYAYFLSPDDLLVSQDPLLLRKHRYLEYFASVKGLFPRGDLIVSNAGFGSYLQGGFADFPSIAGKVAISGAKPSPAASALAEAQMASLRATDWNRLTEQDMLLFGLRIRLAREWVLHAGADAKLLADLQQATYGILSPSRRGALLDAVAARDWDLAFKNVTLGDLYSLSTRYLDSYSRDAWPSPVLNALRAHSPAGGDEGLRELGPVATEILGCSHAHLSPMAAYEEYESLLLPYRLAERAAEFKLYLAEFAAESGLPPAALNALAQPAALEMVKRMKMTDPKDWRDALAAFAALDETAVLAAMPSHK